MLAERVYIMDSKHQQKAILNGVDWATFCVSWAKNDQYQIDFTIYKTNSVGYSLLENENIIEFRGQQYVIKTYNPQFTGGIQSIQISATHIGFECQYIFQASKKNGPNNLSINDAMHWLFDGNVKGFTWETRGNFSNRTLTDFGACNAKDGLSTILQNWSCDMTFDNTHIIIWSHDAYLHKTNQTIRYLHDTDQIQLTGDSTSIINKRYCIGATGDNDQPKYFQPFWSYDVNSINRWGEKVGSIYSNDLPTNRNDMDQAAKATMNLNPTFSIVINYNQTQFPEFGSQVYLEVIPMNVKEWVEITGFKLYPLSPNQKGEIDLNSLQPNILNINHDIESNISRAVNNAISNNIIGNVPNNTPTVSNQSLETNYGVINLSLNQNIVYVDFKLNNISSNTTITTFDSPFKPSKDKIGNLIVTSDQNYIVNYEIDSQGNFKIIQITDLMGNDITIPIKKVNGNFNYLI